jgi:hypothetical protein
MDLFAIRRRNAWATPEDLQAAGARSAEEREKAGSGVRSIRSYVIEEHDGTLGSVCIYEAESPEHIRAHANRAGLPVDEIGRVVDTAIVSPDPAPVSA